MTKIHSLIAVVAVLLLGSSTSAAAASAAPTLQPTNVSTSAAPAAPAPGEVCVDIIDKKLDAQGHSTLLGSACSQALEQAKSLATAAASKNAATSSTSATQSTQAVTLTHLMDLFINYNQDSLQRQIYGSSGTCDSAGYTFAAYSADVTRISSSKGFGSCNTVRLRNTSGSLIYRAMPYNFEAGWNDNTNEYHPYCIVFAGSSCP